MTALEITVLKTSPFSNQINSSI